MNLLANNLNETSRWTRKSSDKQSKRIEEICNEVRTTPAIFNQWCKNQRSYFSSKLRNNPTDILQFVDKKVTLSCGLNLRTKKERKGTISEETEENGSRNLDAELIQKFLGISLGLNSARFFRYMSCHMVEHKKKKLSVRQWSDEDWSGNGPSLGQTNT